MDNVIRQAGAIPYRHDPDGLKVLLITSRGTGRWVIPKGGIMKNASAPQAAKREAFEEAGIRGELDPKPLGWFSYFKRLRSGRVRAASVEVYALRVRKQLKKFPERGERRFVWVTVAAAMGLVDEPGMSELLRGLQESHGSENAAAAN